MHPTATDGPSTAAPIAAALTALRERSPLVQCLTNIVVAQRTADVLLAAGAAPAMVDNAAEAGPFAAIADAVLVNLGTPYADTADAMRAAVRGAADAGTPWVLDPVAVGPLRWRTDLALELLAIAPPRIVRGNASEVLALAGGAGGKGVDSVDSPDAALDTARRLADRLGTTVAVSGAVDVVTDGPRVLRVRNGHPLMTRVTGVGCALGALMAAFAAAVDDPIVAATAATALLTVAADASAATAAGPGTFAVGLLDEVAAVSPDRLLAETRLA